MHSKPYPKLHTFSLILGASGLLALVGGCPTGDFTLPGINQDPTADAGADITIDVGQRGTLNGLGSTDADDDPLTFIWQQRSGPPVTLDDANTAQPSFVPVEEGFYEFALTVTDGRGGSDISVVRVFVGDVDPATCPRADAGTDQTVNEGAAVRLRGGNSADPGGGPLTFEWFQLSGPQVSINGVFIVEPSFAAPQVTGADIELEFELSVTNEQGCPDRDTIVITVRDRDPGDPCNGVVCGDDGLFCNGVESCDGGTCVSSGDPCSAAESCDEQSDACTTAPCDTDADCDDGQFCNGAERCVAGECQDGAPPCTQNATCASIEDGLIAKWNLDGDAVDATGNGHNGVVHGASPVADRLGNPTGAMAFDGNDYLSVPDDSAFTLGTAEFTMAAWVTRDAFGADGGCYLFAHSNGPGDTSKWILWLGSTGISFITTQPGWIELASYGFSLDEWNHVAVRRRGDTLTAFVDGSPIGSAPYSLSIPNPSQPLTIGTAEFDRPNRYLQGALDEVRFYSRALSDAEVQALSAQGDDGTPPCTFPNALEWRISDGGNGHLYEAVLANGDITWEEAQEVATARGDSWHLATITSEAENELVKSLFANNPDFFKNFGTSSLVGRVASGPWLGASSSTNASNDWQWVTGEAFGFSQWGPFEPFGNGNHISYAEFGPSQQLAWNDIPSGVFSPQSYVLECSVGSDACTTGACDEEKDSCLAPPECATDADCDDTLFCNGTETCADGQCQAGVPPCANTETCDEEADSCTAPPECTSAADCDDDLFCNGTETCVDSQCQAGAAPCTFAETCDEATDECTTLFQDFELGQRLWFADNGVWEVGSPASGPGACHQGTQCAGTVLNGNYPFTASRLISPAVRLGHGTVLNPIFLRFWHWFAWGGSTGGNPGRGVVQISVFDTTQATFSEWMDVSTFFSSSSSVWTQVVVDLTAFSGELVRLAFFHQGANAFSSGAGWFVDEIEIVGIDGCSDDPSPAVNSLQDFELGQGLWSPDNGVWEVGSPTAGPGACHQGTQCAGTVLNGNYPFAHSRLISPAFQLPDGPRTPLTPLLLSFWHWFAWGGATGGNPGRGVVQISVFDTTQETFSEWMNVSRFFSSSSGVWTLHLVDISSFAGEIVRLGLFHQGANAFSTGAGWYLDEIEVLEVSGCAAEAN